MKAVAGAGQLDPHCPEQRFRVLDDPRLDRSGECWLWNGGRTGLGYGRVGEEYVHRLVYAQEVGPIPEGHGVLHRCDNPPCARPDHLFTGTQADNIRDALAKGRLDLSGLQRRGEWTHCSRGHEFTLENTYRNPRGIRECRICKRANHRAFRARQGR